MRRLFYLSHAEVEIDPAVPVPEWRLSARGMARHGVFARHCPPLAAVWSSTERKACDGAASLAAAQGLSVRLLETLGENDRSATGYLPGPQFEATADAFFARPDESVQGWERAIDAQARIIGALRQVIAAEPHGDLAVVAHGGVGALLRAHLLGMRIDRSHDQPAGGGGHLLVFGLPDWRLLTDWTRIEDWEPTQDQMTEGKA